MHYVPFRYGRSAPPRRVLNRELPLRRLSVILTAVTLVLGIPGFSTASADLADPLLSGTVRTISAPAETQSSRIGAGGGWCWFSDSRAVFSAGRTYNSWIDITGRIYVGAYDHLTDRMQTVAIATRFNPDDHNNPSLLVHNDGRISAFWSGHNGPAIHVRTTRNPHDIFSFGPRRDVSSRIPGDADVTYTNPIQVPAENNRIYLFWRSHHSHQAYATSDDQGRTWSRARVLIEQYGHRPYVKYDQRNGVIGMAFTNGHPRDIPTSIHYAALKGGVIHGADGRQIQQMDAGGLAPGRADVIWDAKRTGVRAWVWDVAMDVLGRPVVVFTTLRSTNDHRYHYAQWDGSRWNVRELARAGGSIADSREPHYTAGISLDHDNPSMLVMSRRSSRGVHEIERWATTDGGASWTTTPLTVNSRGDNVRPIVTRGLGALHKTGVSWLNGSYGYFTQYRTTVVTNGTLPRMQDLRTSARISSSASRVPRGASVTIRARLVDAANRGLPHREMTLLVRERGTFQWHRVLERRTDGAGLVSFRPKVYGQLEYAVEWPGDYVHLRSQTPVAPVGVRR